MIDFELDKLEIVEEPEAVYSINRELNLAWDIIENTGSNLFLTGKAGTGKTTFLKRLQQESSKNLVVLAPTGVAAINAGGTTIHSFFQFPFSPFLPGKGFIGNDKKFLNMTNMKKRLISSLSLLVIDEVSMVRPDMLDAIDWSLRRLKNSRKPFGGVQLLLIGDIRQLPPVVKEEEWTYLKPYYSSPYFFESHALKDAGYQAIELTKVFRQKDEAFIDILNKIRDGKADALTLQKLNSNCFKGNLPDNLEGYIRLTTHNYRAAKINNDRLSALPSKEWSFEAQVSGKFPEYSFPADKILHIKEGAQVMFIKNDTGMERKFYNGLIGKVVSVSEEKIRVKPLNGEHVIDVVPLVWGNMEYSVNEATGQVIQNEVGKFEQYPLQLAWAITIHKSQGLTFDKAIIDASYSFAPGQTYVALSRCKTLDGLLLETPIPPQAIIIDKEANEFVRNYENNPPTVNLIETYKKQYLVTLFCELFNFESIKISLNDFLRLVMEYVIPIYPNLQSEVDKIEQLFNTNISEVADKFIRVRRNSDLETELDDSERKLIDRIRKGADYFVQKLNEVDKLTNSIPIHLDNKNYTTRLLNSYESFSNLMHHKISLMKLMSSQDFNIKNYLNSKARISIQEVNRPYPSRPIKERSPRSKKDKRQKGYTLFETLRLYQSGNDIEAIAAKRGLVVSTIVDHVAELLKIQRLKAEDIASTQIINGIERICNENSGKSYQEIFELVKENFGVSPINQVFIRLFRNRKANN